MRTLIITNSLDVTADLIVNELGSNKIIRINFDRPQDWSIKLSDSEFEISSSIGTFLSADIAKCNWRKPFISDIEIAPYNTRFYSEEWKYMLYEIANFFRAQNKLLFNFPTPDYIVGKLYQQRIAKKYFKVSPAHISINQKVNTKKPLIVKSLSSEPMGDMKVLYTTDVTGLDLDENFWFSQDKVISNYDVTVVFLNGKMFAYELDRSMLNGIDWRKDQFRIANHWNPIKLKSDTKEAIDAFMSELGYSYGRLDLLRSVNNYDELLFLEVNKNGQWAWLDAKRDNGLFSAMINEYEPDNE